MMNSDKKNKLWFHLLLIFGICAVMYVLFFTSLGWLTDHGSEIRVPALKGKDLKTAISELKAKGFDVQVDSAFEPEIQPFTVLNQQPEADAVVKIGRVLFLTVNKAEPPKTAMPNLVGLSFRSAVSILRSNRLLLGDTSFKPDIAKGAVLEQLLNGKKLKAGEIIPQGSKISLVIGDGLGQTEMTVPDLMGASYAEVMATISAMGLQASPVFEGDITDSSAAIIYNQQPAPFNDLGLPNMIHEGDMIDIFIKQNPTQEEIDNNKMKHTGVIDSL